MHTPLFKHKMFLDYERSWVESGFHDLILYITRNLMESEIYYKIVFL